MDWSRLSTISAFDDENAGFINNGNGFCLANCPSMYMTYNDPKVLTTIKPTTAISLLIEGLIQLVCKLIEDDNRNVNTSYRKICEELNARILIDDSYARNEFADIRTYYEKKIYQIIRAVRQKLPIEFTTLKNIEISAEEFYSRYKREFEEVRFIAGGGFGRVFQARHKLDSIDYAVKQIQISSSKIELYHFAEVKTIASLNHPNIVQYKSAWLEPILPKMTERTESTNDSSESTQPKKCENKSTSSGNSLQLMKYNSDYSLQTAKTAILYIQMSLCKLTLQEWLFARNSCSKTIDKIAPLKVVHNIFCQILGGLNYIHSKQIIHHDIKPSNIFLDFEENGDIVAQLGDFGLACPLQDDHRGYPLGTKLYAAPEQLEGECNPKSDVYSLGIVLLELLIKYNTDMERIKIIENARKGIFPSELTIPSVHLLKSLLSSKKSRPSTTEVLKLLRKVKFEKNVTSQVTLKEDETELQSIQNYKIEINCLKDEIIYKNQQIQELNETLLAKDKEVNELRKMLKRYES